MGMLAEGYTRAYIREALDVSDVTAKAHIAHVYAKLGIHHKDDLLDYIDQRVAQDVLHARICIILRDGAARGIPIGAPTRLRNERERPA